MRIFLFVFESFVSLPSFLLGFGLNYSTQIDVDFVLRDLISKSITELRTVYTST
jgi:hypothetical protein